MSSEPICLEQLNMHYLKPPCCDVLDSLARVIQACQPFVEYTEVYDAVAKLANRADDIMRLYAVSPKTIIRYGEQDEAPTD